ncbi:MAG: hypothetical protein JSR83_01895 [Proteobacteria bacterium]|nr:hypothetical protein [Pseudomonadota bacterium]
MREMTVTVYSFNELSEAAQKRVLNEFSDINVEFNWYEDTFGTIRAAGELLGLEIGDIYFDAYSYCIFDASYEYVRGAAKAVRNEFPQDTKLHGIAKDLQALQKRHFYSLSCAVTEGRSMNHYRCFRFGEDYECKDLGDIIDDFARWARILLRDEYKYLTSDEAVKEMIEANGYEFTEAGKLV